MVPFSVKCPKVDFSQFPPDLAEWLLNNSGRMVCDPQLVLSYVLSASSILLGYSQVTMPTEWVVAVNIWTIAVGQSGSNKTGAYDFVAKAVNAVFDELVEEEVFFFPFFCLGLFCSSYICLTLSFPF